MSTQPGHLSGEPSGEQFTFKRNARPVDSLKAPILEREDVKGGLKALVNLLHRGRTKATVRLIGGAAIALAYNARRRATADIDAELIPSDVILEASEKVGAEQGWRSNWLNDAATQFLPNGFGRRQPEWRLLYSVDDVEIYIAEPEFLLAMKLHSIQRRGQRELNDLRTLVHIVGLKTAEDAEEIFESFYVGDAFTDRTIEYVQYAIDHPPESDERPEGELLSF